MSDDTITIKELPINLKELGVYLGCHSIKSFFDEYEINNAWLAIDGCGEMCIYDTKPEFFDSFAAILCEWSVDTMCYCDLVHEYEFEVLNISPADTLVEIFRVGDTGVITQVGEGHE